MTQPPTYPTPPAGGPSPTAGGFAPPSGPTPQGYAVPPQPGPYSGLPSYPAGPPGAPFRPGLPGVPLAPNGQPLASFGDRLLAVLIDGLVLMAACMVVIVPAVIAFFVWVTPDLTATAPDGTLQSDPFTDFLLPFLALEAAILLFSIGITYLFHVEMMFKTGQTVGKRVMKLRVVPIDPTQTLDRKAAAKRWLAHQVGGSFIPGFSYVDGLWQLWDKPWQQCLHDKFARTVVVKVSG
ncbi:RDD family protein [Micromonospora sp. 4G55]|uniref:RDD family protein n=1 Tax=Micromonospora sp. 4G55 TaxID=2806102 RepID=UPI001A59AB27|nr:RDD family protein [Micromonospora sp. 4G55]MBM0255961.1 RDD family protein [Micromonospora sp. 4G55]